MFMQLLSINENTRVGKIQNEFNAVYPFLRIDFLKDEIKKSFLHKHEKIIIENKIDIDKQRTVAQLKKDFKELCGLTAEVFRKSGNVWIETSLTDDWTLEHQNREAEFFAKERK